MAVWSLILAAGGPLAAAQQDQSRYAISVDAYRQHGTDALRTFLTIGQADLDAGVAAATADRAGWDWRRLRAAAMLHTEAFLHYVETDRTKSGLFHVAAARRLLDAALERAPGATEFVVRWYAIVERIARASEEPLLAQPLRVAQQDRWGERRRFYNRGVQDEVRGNLEGFASRFDAHGHFVDFSRSQARWFESAVVFYQRALDADSSFEPAALRLGRILMIQGQLAAASEALRRAAGSADAYTAYLALLFLGSIDEREGRLDQAESLYVRAMKTYPYGQSACVALSHLWKRRGNAANASGVLLRCVGPDRDKVVEPLWTFGAEPDDALAARLDELRVESLQ